MNTIKSFYVGWGALIVAGGGAYYFAKQSINADRQTRFEADQKRRRTQEALEHSEYHPNKSTSKTIKENGGPAHNDTSGSPSKEASVDPAATRHAPHTLGQQVREKSKYEASEPYKSRKGDRFS